jgi:hypothetical protein
VNSTLQSVIADIALTTPATSFGVASASPTLNETGVYQISVNINSSLVPGSPYNITVLAGPPSAATSTVQVRFSHQTMQPTVAMLPCNPVQRIVLRSIWCTAWARRPTGVEWNPCWLVGNILPDCARQHWRHCTKSVPGRFQHLNFWPWCAVGIDAFGCNRSHRHLCRPTASAQVSSTAAGVWPR